jgi:AraC family transcriptional regulator, regulatory protein of adaptative response / DNA-3-methyladenine glycosylase II
LATGAVQQIGTDVADQVAELYGTSGDLEGHVDQFYPVVARRRVKDKTPDPLDASLSAFLGVRGQILANPGGFPNPAAIARETGIAVARLEDLFRDHAHLTIARWLQRAQIQRAAGLLLGGAKTTSHAGADSGFASEAQFETAFLNEMRMTPSDYRRLDAVQGFTLRLPKGYRSAEALAYHGRDPESPSERVRGNSIAKALATTDGPVVLELMLDAGQASGRIRAQSKIGRDGVARLHSDALRMLGLTADIELFERQHAAFVKPRRGLRVPLLPSAFEALCWAITGQQINLSFASTLRRALINLAGDRVGDMRVHPTPQALANIDVAELAALRYSRSKARYLTEAAAAIATGQLDIDNLLQGSAVAAERALTAQKGVGVWTARYVLMRIGFADSAPIGDSGLATALHTLHQLPERPDADQAARLMSRFSPHRSLASMHLWALLQEAKQQSR